MYEFASNPGNFPAWARSFVRSARRVGSDWVLETPGGPMRIRFVPRNDFGVLDHAVQPPSGDEITVPMRVVPNGEGSEVVFTLFQLPGMSDEKFAEDAGMVERDLQSLKRVLEQDRGGRRRR